MEQPERHQRHPGLDGGSGDRRQRRRESLHATDASSAAKSSARTQASTWPTPIAAVEGYEAINYLFAHHDWQYIDTNHDGLVTAGELQTFTDNSAAMGLPEAGAMAALLGGTATYGAVEPGLNNQVFNENPDDPAAEQRRFNFFDYAADGQLNGSITMNELKMLSRILLPAPDAYAVTDRQRASANGFLLDPTAQRNFVAMQHTLPQFQWVPESAVKKYRNISPMKFGVDKGVQPGFTFPLYTLFDATGNNRRRPPRRRPNTVVAASKTANIGGVPVTIDWLSNDLQPTPQATAPTADHSDEPHASRHGHAQLGGLDHFGDRQPYTQHVDSGHRPGYRRAELRPGWCRLIAFKHQLERDHRGHDFAPVTAPTTASSTTPA